MFYSIFINAWSLFLSIAFLMLGNGLQGTLTAWRAGYEGFTAGTTGWIMTGYYIGFLGGSLFISVLIKNVGHIRVFAALASLGSAAILIQSLFISPTFWLTARLITGFCYAGIYVIVESWLNEQSDNKNRGSTMALYMLVVFAGIGLGQWLMKTFDPTNNELFILASILLSIAMLPMLLTKISVPTAKEYVNIKIVKLISISPAGVASLFVSQIATGTILGMGAVYGINAGLDITEIAIFMSLLILTGAIGCWLLGRVSDLISRRLVILIISFISSIMCFLLTIQISGTWNYFVTASLLGFFILPIYSITVAHINDRLEPEQMMSASGTIILITGIGSVLGPISSGYILSFFGQYGYLFYLGLINLLISGIILIALVKRKAVPESEQVSYQAITPAPTIVGMEVIAKEAKIIKEGN